MTEIGGVFTTTVQVTGSSFTTVFAPTGEQVKVTMAYSKRQSGANVENDTLNASPASGAESAARRGTKSNEAEMPPVGGNPSNGSSDITTLQPIYITDSDGLYLGNEASRDIDVLIQGVRVA